MNSRQHNSLPKAPQLAPLSRTRETFDFDWKFFQGDANGAEQSHYSDENWQKVDLPHDWSINGPFSEYPDSATSGHLPMGVGWYRKRFHLRPVDAQRKITIAFDGIYQNSQVWLNGHFLGNRPYGYIGFNYDMTPWLDESGDNLIAVRVDNSRQPNCRWYSGSGIYRHTWLQTTGETYIPEGGVFVTLPRVDRQAALIQVQTWAQNEGAINQPCRLVSILCDSEGQEVERGRIARDIPAHEQVEFTQQILVAQPRLWEVQDPYLYTLHSQLWVGESLVDEVRTKVGLRSAEFDVDQGFLLNGHPLKLNGVCLHHDGGAVGAAVPERVWERRLELLKAMGCNAIRTSHNPYAPEFMDLCDRMGFLVMDEVFDEWKVAKLQTPDFGYRLYYDTWAERDLSDFIRRDRNHPSVVLWSAGNEVGDQADPEGAARLKKLMEVFHREDPSRLVTVGCDLIVAEPSAATEEFLSALDVVGYNYVDRWRGRAEKYYSIDRHAHPDWRFIGTESPGMYGVRGDYSELFPEEPGAPRRWWRSNRGLNVEQLWKFVRTYDYVAGDFMWTGIDHIGEAWWPAKSSSTGVLDTCGFEKDGYYFYQSQWTDAPMLHLLPHWNWQGKEGEFIPVLCYTNCDTVELFLNGKSLGAQGYWFPRQGMEKQYGTFPARGQVVRTTADLHLTWTVPYTPGVLKAVGTRDGQVVICEEVVTSGEAAAIQMVADRPVLTADRRDLAHVTVRIVDAQGRLVPTANPLLTFEVQGAGALIGLDNGDPLSHEDFKGLTRQAFHGLALAMVQAGSQAGSIVLRAASPGLLPSTITLQTRQAPSPAGV